MSKNLCRLLIAILMLGLGGITHTAFGQCLCDPGTPSAAEGDCVVLERDDFKEPVDRALQQILAPTIPGTCLTVVGAIREGFFSDAEPPVMNPFPDYDTYQLVFSAPIAPTTFILTLKHYLDNDNNPENDNTFMLGVVDPATDNRLIRDCSMELTACAVQISSNVNLTITGFYAGVYTLSITQEP